MYSVTTIQMHNIAMFTYICTGYTLFCLANSPLTVGDIYAIFV